MHKYEANPKPRLPIAVTEFKMGHLYFMEGDDEHLRICIRTDMIHNHSRLILVDLESGYYANETAGSYCDYYDVTDQYVFIKTEDLK